MDDAIVIILTIVLMVAAAINQQKKKKQQLVADEPEEPDFWKSIFQGGDNEQPLVNEPTVKAEPILQKVVKKVKRAAQPQNYNVHNFEGGRSETVENILVKKTAKLNEENDDGDEDSVMMDFSLRKAIIYSEILRPKYF